MPDDQIPTVEDLRTQARTLVRRYASQEAYEQALSKRDSLDAPVSMKVPMGSIWNTPSNIQSSQPAALDILEQLDSDSDDSAEVKAAETVEVTSRADAEASELRSNPGDEDVEVEGTKGKKATHVEAKGFDGDRVLANAILFLQDAGWWVEANYAVPDGDIGRVFEILKVRPLTYLSITMLTYHFEIWIFSFTGTSNRNYSSWLLEVYCFFRYEASKDLSDALLNNWLVNLTGELGKWIEADLMQEHYNRWLEDMAGKLGGEFDDRFYRHTLSPNVHHFLRIKEQIESAFELRQRSKAHGSAHLRDEYQSLLRMYREDELHRFRSCRSMGHAAMNTFDCGNRRLEGGRLEKFLTQSLAYSDIVKEMKSPAEGRPDSNGNTSEVSSGIEGELQSGGHDSSESESDGDSEDEQYRPTAEQRSEICARRPAFVDQDSGAMVIDDDDSDGADHSSDDEVGVQADEDDYGYDGTSEDDHN